MNKTLEAVIFYPIAISMLFIVIGIAFWIMFKVVSLHLMPSEIADVVFGAMCATVFLSALYGLINGLPEELA